jgi:hypothetical protein
MRAISTAPAALAPPIIAPLLIVLPALGDAVADGDETRDVGDSVGDGDSIKDGTVVVVTDISTERPDSVVDRKGSKEVL